MSDKISKLSQAIRLGATFRPHGRAKLWTVFGDGVIKSCALGAAYEAVFGLPQSHHENDGIDGNHYTKLQGRFPELKAKFNGFGSDFVCLQDNITKANDNHGMSREQIADELERIGL